MVLTVHNENQPSEQAATAKTQHFSKNTYKPTLTAEVEGKIGASLLTCFEIVDVEDTRHLDTSHVPFPCLGWPRLLPHVRNP